MVLYNVIKVFKIQFVYHIKKFIIWQKKTIMLIYIITTLIQLQNYI